MACHTKQTNKKKNTYASSSTSAHHIISSDFHSSFFFFFFFGECLQSAAQCACKTNLNSIHCSRTLNTFDKCQSKNRIIVIIIIICDYYLSPRSGHLHRRLSKPKQLQNCTLSRRRYRCNRYNTMCVEN